MSMNAGFIGMGKMGKWMALNLMKAGFKLTVYDIDTEPVDFLSSNGAEAVDSPAEMAGKSEVIVFSLPDATVVESAVMGANGIVNRAKEGLILVDCGTSDYFWTMEFGTSLLKRGIRFVDAPVTGLESRAKDGTLTIMFGGDKSTLEILRPLLDAIGSTILHMGGVGKGQLSKMTNNLIYDINLAALAEVLPMAVKLGLEPDKIARVINTGSGRSFASEFFLPHILEGKFDNSYCLEKAYKDLAAAASISAQKKIPLPVAHAATSTYQMALAAGLGKEDKGAMIKVFEKINGVQFRSKQEG
jgi:3-hydroxyisobutyrate dehydrogenase-like beta-hydroxyacid dehydrogenase